jgi:ankyrin repeat protein
MIVIRMLRSTLFLLGSERASRGTHEYRPESPRFIYGEVQAAERDDVAKMEELRSHGVSLCGEHDDLLPIHVAAMAGSINAINYLLNREVLVDVTLVDEKTALHFAVEYYQNDVVLVLLQRGASPIKFSYEQKKGINPLMYAAKSGKIEAAGSLLSYGASILDKNRKGENAFSVAAELGNRELCRIFGERDETQDWIARNSSSGRLSPLVKKLIEAACS